MTGSASGGFSRQSPVNLGSAGSRPIAQFWPTIRMQNGKDQSGHHNNAERDAFKHALYATLEGKAEGLLSPYLFYDPPEFAEIETIDYQKDWGSRDNIPYGAPSWDAHIAESTSDNPEHKRQNKYAFAEGDEEVIKTALQEGLVSLLPKRMTYYSYGPGELIAVGKKDFQVIDAIERSPSHVIEALNALDINDRYARTFARAANERYNKATSAVQGDFMEGTLNLGAKVGTSVIAIFGGPFANAPSIKDHMTAKQKAASYLAQLVSQHGEGTRVINTIETESNKKVLLAGYKATRAFEAFILSALPRAVHQGIIRNQNYDVFKNWKLVTEFSEAESAIKLIARAKRTHTLETEDKTFYIQKHDEPVFTLSNKWSEREWGEIYNAAGLGNTSFYGTGSRKLVLATAIKDPDLSLI